MEQTFERSSEDWLEPEAQRARRSTLGLGDEGRTSNFVASCEYISLGCHPVVATSLQALGLRKHSFPFDDTRAGVEGLLSCLDDFDCFLSYSYELDHQQHGVGYANSAWGGSFWGQDVDSPAVREEYARRVERFQGRNTDVPFGRPRIFVRAVNCTRELVQTRKLHMALRKMLPDARIYLLVIVDFQQEPFALRLPGLPGESLLFCGVPNLYDGSGWSLERHCDVYAQAIALATRVWAGRAGAVAKVEEVSTLQDVTNRCSMFDGGSPGCEPFFPRAPVVTTLLPTTTIVPRSTTMLPSCVTTLSAPSLPATSTPLLSPRPSSPRTPISPRAQRRSTSREEASPRSASPRSVSPASRRRIESFWSQNSETLGGKFNSGFLWDGARAENQRKARKARSVAWR